MTSLDLKPLPKMVANPSGITPLEYNVLVQPQKVEERTSGGLWKPEEYRDREQWGETRAKVVAVSPLAFNYEREAPKPGVGDLVIFAKSAGTMVEGADGEEYRLIKDKDVLAVMEARHE